LEQPGGDAIRVFEGEECGEDGIKLAAWRGRGVRVRSGIGEESGAAASGVSCSSRSLRGGEG
jgi:hypothetical protein